MEPYLCEDGLVSEEQWHALLDGLSVPDQAPSLLALQDALKTAIRKRMPAGPVGVLFSGGVDSALLAVLLRCVGATPLCHVAGFQTAHGEIPKDVVQARAVAKAMGLSLKEHIFREAESRSLLKKTVHILGREATVVKTGVAGVVVAARSLAPGLEDFFSGLGSEELFAGYDRHLQNPNTEECWAGLHSMYRRDLVRDTTLARALHIRLHTPFLDLAVIRLAMALPMGQKLREGTNKWVIRRIAADLGLGEHAFAKKRAAQYGSSLDKMMAKLARREGHPTRQAFLDTLRQESL